MTRKVSPSCEARRCYRPALLVVKTSDRHFQLLEFKKKNKNKKAQVFLTFFLVLVYLHGSCCASMFTEINSRAALLGTPDMVKSCFQPGELSHEYIFHFNASLPWRHIVNISWAPASRLWQTTTRVLPLFADRKGMWGFVLCNCCAVCLKAHVRTRRELLVNLVIIFREALAGDSLSIRTVNAGKACSPNRSRTTDTLWSKETWNVRAHTVCNHLSYKTVRDWRFLRVKRVVDGKRRWKSQQNVKHFWSTLKSFYFACRYLSLTLTARVWRHWMLLPTSCKFITSIMFLWQQSAWTMGNIMH